MATHPTPHPTPQPSKLPKESALLDSRNRGIHIVYRRPTRTQGQALEALGHAVEYLVDSRLTTDQQGPSEHEAIEILKRASRTVFAECPETRSWMRRLRHWLDADLSGRNHQG